MIDKEKLIDITNAINKEPSQKYRVKLLEKWLRQNQPETKINIDRKSIKKLTDKIFEHRERWKDIELVLLSWFSEQNQSEPVIVAVGLSNEQVLRYALSHSQNEFHAASIGMQFKAWQNTQTFAQPSEAAKTEIKQLTEQLNEANRLVGDYIKICDDGQKEIDELQNKCQKLKSDLKVVKEALQFNWDDAPDDAVRTQIVCNFLDAKGIPLVRSYLICEEPRPKPTPQVYGDSHRPNWEADFEQWWQTEGVLARSGGTEYAKTFAYRAWEAAANLNLESRQFTPDWSNVPDLAEWIAIDDCGIQSWHELEPYYDEDMQGHGSEGENGTVFDESRRKIFKRPKPTPQVFEVDKVVQKLNQNVFLQQDERYKFASVVGGKAQLMTHKPVEKQDSFGREYLGYPVDAFVQPLEGDFENTDLIIERVS